jgi:hypothetical protein
LHQARRPAAKKHAVHLLTASSELAKLTLDRIEIDVDAIEARRLPIEVAVRTDRQTKRKVDVQRDAHGEQQSVRTEPLSFSLTGFSHTSV